MINDLLAKRITVLMSFSFLYCLQLKCLQLRHTLDHSHQHRKTIPRTK
jgi:hypothetical protein